MSAGERNNPSERRWPAGGPNSPRPSGPRPISAMHWSAPGKNAVRDGRAIQVGPGIDEVVTECSPEELQAKAIARALSCLQLNTRMPSYVHQTSTATPFVACTQTDIVVSDGAWVEVVSIDTDRNVSVVIKEIGQQLPAAVNFDDVIWRIAVGNRPHTAFSNIGCQLGSVQQPAEMTIKIGSLHQAAHVSLQARKLTPGNVDARGLMRGWTMSNSAPGDSPRGWFE